MTHITHHAITRAIERIPGCNTEDQARGMLDCTAVRRAIAFGAPYVRLGTGQRIVIHCGSVVTVLPKEHWQAAMDRRRTIRFEQRSEG